MISKLLILGSTEDTDKRGPRLHLPEHILKHQELVHAVLMQIKPGLLSVLCRRFTKGMLVDYLHKVKHDHLRAHLKAMQEKAENPAGAPPAKHACACSQVLEHKHHGKAGVKLGQVIDAATSDVGGVDAQGLAKLDAVTIDLAK